MTTGKVTLSIDLELAWGVWDTITAQELRLADTAERPICAALVELLDRYQVPASWLVVAGLLDEASARSRPGPTSCWYAPDVIERIVGAKVRHEIGSHGGRHIYFDQISASEARDDLAFAAGVHRAHSLGFESFVFPRGAVGHLVNGRVPAARLISERVPLEGLPSALERLRSPGELVRVLMTP